jgi:hypothetical protein
MDHLAAANLGESDGVLVHSKKTKQHFFKPFWVSFERLYKMWLFYKCGFDERRL